MTGPSNHKSMSYSAMKAARKSFGVISRGLGELAGTLGKDKSLPIDQPAPQLYPPQLSIDDAAGEDLLHVRSPAGIWGAWLALLC